MNPLRSRAVKQSALSSPLRILAAADGGAAAKADWNCQHQTGLSISDRHENACPLSHSKERSPPWMTQGSSAASPANAFQRFAASSQP
jgi:hypothetical protein